MQKPFNAMDLDEIRAEIRRHLFEDHGTTKDEPYMGCRTCPYLWARRIKLEHGAEAR